MPSSKTTRKSQVSKQPFPDELFARFPLHLVPTYPGDAELFASEAFRALLPERPALRALSLAEVMA